MEARKAKDKESNLIINRQRDTIVKAKKDYRFEYILSYKAVNRGSDEKEYIRILRCLEYTHLIYLNPFSFKAHETGTVEYQALIRQARKYRVSNISYLES